MKLDYAVEELNEGIQTLHMWRGEAQKIDSMCDNVIGYASAIMSRDKTQCSVIVRSLQVLSKYDEKMIRLIKFIPEDMTQAVIEELYEKFLAENEPISKGILRYIITNMVAQYFSNDTNGKGLDIKFVLLLVQKGWFNKSYDVLYKIFQNNIEDICRFAFSNTCDGYRGELLGDVARNALETYVIFCGAHDLEKVMSTIPESMIKEVMCVTQRRAMHISESFDPKGRIASEGNGLLSHSVLYLLRSSEGIEDRSIQCVINFLYRMANQEEVSDIVAAMKVEGRNKILRALQNYKPKRANKVANIVIGMSANTNKDIDLLDTEMLCRFVDLMTLNHKVACKIFSRKIDEIERMFAIGNGEVIIFVTRAIPRYLDALQGRNFELLRRLVGSNGIVFHEVTKDMRFNFEDGLGVSAAVAEFLNERFYQIFRDALKSNYTPALGRHFIDVVNFARNGVRNEGNAQDDIVAKFMDIAGSSKPIMRTILQEVLRGFSKDNVSAVIKSIRCFDNLKAIYEDFDKKDRELVLNYLTAAINSPLSNSVLRASAVNFLNPYRKGNVFFFRELLFYGLNNTIVPFYLYSYVRHISVLECLEKDNFNQFFGALIAGRYAVRDEVIISNNLMKYRTLAGVLDVSILCFGNHEGANHDGNLRPLNSYNVANCQFAHHSGVLRGLLNVLLERLDELSIRNICGYVHNIYALRKFCAEMFADTTNLMVSLDNAVNIRNIHYFSLLASTDEDIDKKLVARDLANNVNHSSRAYAETFIESLQGKPKEWLKAIAKYVEDREYRVQIKGLY